MFSKLSFPTPTIRIDKGSVEAFTISRMESCMS